MTTAEPSMQVDVEALVDGYLSGWNEVDASERKAIISRYWSEDCRLVDPPLAGAGHQGVNDIVEALQAHYPDHRFTRVGQVSSHHDAFRVDWVLRGPDDTVALAGTDYGLVADDGRLSRVTGFFDAGSTQQETGR